MRALGHSKMLFVSMSFEKAYLQYYDVIGGSLELLSPKLPKFQISKDQEIWNSGTSRMLETWKLEV